MARYVGSFEHILDAKNRLFLPTKFRDALTGAFTIKLLASRYPCIQCFSNEEFEAYEARELEGITDPLLLRDKLFEVYAGTTEVTVDAQGRIVLPTLTTKNANIDKTVLVVGMGNHVEIWAPDTFNAYYKSICKQRIESEEATEAEQRKKREHKANGDYLPG